MSDNKVTIIDKLNSTTPLQIVNLPEVADRFKKLYLTFNGKDGERFYEAEKFHFSKILAENPKLQACTKLSLYGCFLDMAVNGLSFDPAMKHAYMIPRAAKVAKRNDQGVIVESWEDRAHVDISGQGELVLRMQQGQIKYADNPILVYEGDNFKMGSREGNVYVDHEVILPRQSDNILACYVKITRNDGSIDYKVITMPEIERLRKSSKQPNSLAWTDGLPGMIQTKCIKHAFRGYPKLRVLGKSNFSQLASEIIDEDPIEQSQDIYAIDEPIPTEKTAQLANGSRVTMNKPVEDKEPIKVEVAQAENFAEEAPKQSAGKVVHDDNF